MMLVAASPADSFYVSTPIDVVGVMLKHASLERSDVLYDLGSGNGWIVVNAALKYKCKAVGIERDSKLVDLARRNARNYGVDDLVEIEEQDLRVELGWLQADVITVYLSPDMLDKLPFNRLIPGTRVIAHNHPVPDIPHVRKVKVKSMIDGREHTVYVQQVSMVSRRLKGPEWGKSGCNCLMCIGNHLVGTHNQDYGYLREIGSGKWRLLHNNLHNLGRSRQ
jgi:protein-L-isoaspartate O-methyltransferase